MTTVSASANHRMGGDHAAGHFSSLPKTTMGWIATGVAIAYIVLAAVMANTALGLPTWLDFSLALIPGVVAAILVGIALIRERERSWLIWLVAAGLVVFLGQSLLMVAMLTL